MSGEPGKLTSTPATNLDIFWMDVAKELTKKSIPGGRNTDYNHY
jgi:hypothetical protein